MNNYKYDQITINPNSEEVYSYFRDTPEMNPYVQSTFPLLFAEV
jgi:hypothetical protein